MTSGRERYEQVGWLHTPTGEVHSMTEWDYIRPETHEPVYVKVPVDPVAPIMQELERCPTCGSDNPGGEIMPAHIESEDQLLGFLCGEGRCPDPWHSTARPQKRVS